MAMQQFLAGHREWDGYDYFGRLAEQQPARRALFGSLQGLMQARVAGDVALLRRVAWVESAIAKLDAGVAADPLLGRLARGLVFADLPPRFGKASQAAGDLEFVLGHADDIPVSMFRGIYRGLAGAYHDLGNEQRSVEMLRLSGFTSLEETPRLLVDVAVSPTDGFRFGRRRLVKEAENVYVAEGYDFANLSFLLADDFVVAIDAGTNERTAREAREALRTVTRAPIKYIILTHGHWDHVGGLAALRDPGSIVIAQAAFPTVLARSRRAPPPIHDFFGSVPQSLDVTPDRLVSSNESLSEGGLDLALLPGPSGETEDALYVLDKKHDILFVGDAFMPYLGAPFVAEGSAEGYRAAIDFVLNLKPRRLVHGHSPLSWLFTIEAMPGLRDATAALFAHTIDAANAARSVADVLHDGFIPPGLRASPKAVAPFLVLRDGFVQRTYQEHGGYWQRDGTGVNLFTREEWARSLDLLAGESDTRFVRAVRALLDRGDAPMAFQLAESGLLQHPDSTDLRAARQMALSTLLERTAAASPFRFIMYSEWSGKSLAPVAVPGQATTH